MSKSSNYWRKREREWKKADLKDEAEYIQEIQDIYSTMLTQINKEIESFFVRYSNKEGMSMAEAKRKASDIDIKEYEKKAKKYVKEKDFSKEANEQMRLYNLAMKVNRLELLKANIGLELTAGSDELVSFTKEKLEGAALEQIQRNAGILGDTIVDNAKTAKTIANSSFKNATFSERIWSQQDLLKNDLYGILSTALIQGRNPREFIPKVRKSFDVTRYQAERLLRTELTRVRIQAQAESYEANGIDEYEYVACGLKDVCPICKVLDKQIFKLKDMEIGENAPPRHPNCHCALAPYSDRKVYEQWLNGLANGEHDLRFDEWKEQEVTRNLAIRNKNIYGIPTYHSETINKKTQKKVDQALHNVFKEYPEMREFIKKIEFSDKMEDSELASAVINRKLETTLRLNKNLFSDSKKLNDLLSNCPSVFTKKSSIEDYLTHECIHFLEWKYAIEKQQKKAFDYIEQDYYSRLLLKKACKECDLSYNDSVIEKEICLYARLKASEAIAEACSGGTSRLAKKIKYLVDKEWRGH